MVQFGTKIRLSFLVTYASSIHDLLSENSNPWLDVDESVKYSIDVKVLDNS